MLTIKDFHETFIDSGMLRDFSVEGCEGLHLWVSDDLETVWRWCERLPGAVGATPPYWVAVWPSGQALARFMVENAAHLAGARVLDLGTGGGVCAIAAARSGAARVVAVDIDPLACAATQFNANANGVEVHTVCVDVLGEDQEDFDLIVAADLWYERFLAQRVSTWLKAQSRKGTRVWIGDSGRAYFPREGLGLMAQYRVGASAHLESAPEVTVGIYSLSVSTQTTCASGMHRVHGIPHPKSPLV